MRVKFQIESAGRPVKRQEREVKQFRSQGLTALHITVGRSVLGG